MDQGIQAFYPPGSLGPIAQRVARSGALDAISTQWRIPKELAMDLIKLSLFDSEPAVPFLHFESIVALSAANEVADPLPVFSIPCHSHPPHR
jgi:hypothetical protein